MVPMNLGEHNAGAATRRRLLDASERLFAEQGFVSTSIRDIAEASGCNLAAVNYHFSSKENLYHEVMLRRIRSLREHRLSLLAGLMDRFPDGSNLDTVLRGYAEEFLRSKREPERARTLLRLFAHEILHPHLRPGVLLEGFVRPIQDALAGVIRRAQPELSTVEAQLCVHSLLSQLIYLAHFADLFSCPGGQERPSIDQLVDHVVRLTTAGVSGYVVGHRP